MEVGMANKADDGDVPQAGGWWLSANELLLKLQGSNAAIDGEFT
jgi:hypothetical protein